MIKHLTLILNASRWYALPMSFFSWIVIFCYSLKSGGNIYYGLLALFGICFSHLATNLFDDFIDYKFLSKTELNNKTILKNTQIGKCEYILNGSLSLNDILKIIFAYLTLAFIIFLFFYFNVGKYVIVFVAAALLIVFLYPFMSRIRLSEFAVGLIYGPVLFGGTHYVMCGNFSWSSLILSLPTMLFTINLAFTDNILDKDLDINENKKTIAGLFPSNKSLSYFHITLLFFSYLSIFLLCFLSITGWQTLLALITIPFAFDLINSMEKYNQSKTNIPQRKWYHFPMENFNNLKNNNILPYMFRMYQARNLMIYIAIILSATVYF